MVIVATEWTLGKSCCVRGEIVPARSERVRNFRQLFHCMWGD